MCLLRCEVVLTAVSQNGWAMNFADTRYLRDDKGFVLAASARSLIALRFAAESLRADTDFMFAACGQVRAAGSVRAKQAVARLCPVVRS